MDAKALEGKRGGLKEKITNHDYIVEDDLGDDMEEEEGGFGVDGRGAFVDDHGKEKGAIGMVYGKRGTNGSGANSGGMSPPSCQVEKCGADLSDAKRYHRRHKVCEVHSKAPAVVVAGLRQRFCQQCSRFHELTEFDEVKRSCRRRLAGHNERRRKSSVESYAEGSSRKGAIGTHLKEGQYKPEERGRNQMTLPGNSGFKRPQIR